MDDELWKGTEIYLKGAQLISKIISEAAHIADLVKEVTEDYKAYQVASQPILNDIQQGFSELPQRYREFVLVTRGAVLLMAKRGWFLDVRFPLPALPKIAESLLSGDGKDVDEALIAYFEQEADAIERSLVSKFPRRSRLIEAAFRAHRNGEYELSVPVLFSQVDGICFDITNKYLFTSRNNTHDQIEKIK